MTIDILTINALTVDCVAGGRELKNKYDNKDLGTQHCPTRGKNCPVRPDQNKVIFCKTELFFVPVFIFKII